MAFTNVQGLLHAFAVFGSCFVGAVILFAGMAKAAEPENFVRHLEQFRLLPRRWLPLTTLIVTALQCGLGMALLLVLWPRWLLPSTILLLFALAVVGFWGTATGRTTGCGCYNDIFTFSPLQGLLLDAGYIALLAFSWWHGTRLGGWELWRTVAVACAVAAGGALTYASARHQARHHRPFLELSPLKTGHRWDPRWLSGDVGKAGARGEKLVVFLGPDCPRCKRWIKVLNVVHYLTGLPDVLGAVVLSPEKLTVFVSGANIHFPVAPMKPWVLAKLVRGTIPTAVVVEDGVIQEKWVGGFPSYFVDQIRAAMSQPPGPPTHTDDPAVA